MSATSLVSELRRRGHRVELVDGLRVRLSLKAGADAVKARAWLATHEQEIRRELVDAAQALAGIKATFPAGRVRAVVDSEGKPIAGCFEVVEAATFEAAP